MDRSALDLPQYLLDMGGYCWNLIHILTRNIFMRKYDWVIIPRAGVCDCNIVPGWSLPADECSWQTMDLLWYRSTRGAQQQQLFLGWNLKPFDSFLLGLFKFPPVWPYGKVRLICSLFRWKWKEPLGPSGTETACLFVCGAQTWWGSCAAL